MSIIIRETPAGPAVTVLSADALEATWIARDALYANGVRLSDASIRAVRYWRQAEAHFVEPRSRARAYGRATHWAPPEGSVR